MVQLSTPLAGIDITETVAGTGTSSDEGNQIALGTKVVTADGREYVYCHAASAITQYQFVTIDEDWESTPLLIAGVQAGHKIGVAQVAASNNDFHWVAVKGHDIQGNVDASTAADITLHVSPDTSLPGNLGDRTSTSVKIEGVVATAAQAGTSVALNVALLVSTEMHAAASDY